MDFSEYKRDHNDWDFRHILEMMIIGGIYFI